MNWEESDELSVVALVDVADCGATYVDVCDVFKASVIVIYFLFSSKDMGYLLTIYTW